MSQTFEFKIQIEGPGISRIDKIPIRVLAIGRNPANDLVLNHSQVSGRHAQLHCTETDLQLTDLESTNGTVVNGAKLPKKVPISLSDGDVIKIGPFMLTIKQIDLPPQVQQMSQQKEEQRQNEATSIEQGGGSGGGSNGSDGSVGNSKQFGSPKDLLPPGLSIFSRRLINYLPDPYHPPTFDENSTTQYPSSLTFMARFLGMFEAILTPIEWNVDNFNLYLNPGTAPADFLPWLANWYQMAFDSTWDEPKRRLFLKEAHELFAWRGTKKALRRTLEIYTAGQIEIEEPQADDAAYTFNVTIQLPSGQPFNRETTERLIEMHKPAHTMYNLKILS